jgi:hypothetical protein
MSIAKQRLCKHSPTATDTYATEEAATASWNLPADRYLTIVARIPESWDRKIWSNPAGPGTKKDCAGKTSSSLPDLTLLNTEEKCGHGSLIDRNQEWLCVLGTKANYCSAQVESHEKEKYGYESRGARNQERLCWLRPAAIFHITSDQVPCDRKSQDSVTVVRNKYMAMGLLGPGTKNDCAGKDQQQFTRLTITVYKLRHNLLHIDRGPLCIS